MTHADRLRADLIRDEDERLYVYDDATGKRLQPGVTLVGNPTIGIGRNLLGRGITTAESRYLLENDLQESIADLASFPWFEGLSPIRQRVVINLRFALGPMKFRGFRQMLAALQDGAFDRAADELLDSEWARVVGNRARRLARMLRHDLDT